MTNSSFWIGIFCPLKITNKERGRVCGSGGCGCGAREAPGIGGGLDTIGGVGGGAGTLCRGRGGGGGGGIDGKPVLLTDVRRGCAGMLVAVTAFMFGLEGGDPLTTGAVGTRAGGATGVF
jgi:hypothetical protein